MTPWQALLRAELKVMLREPTLRWLLPLSMILGFSSAYFQLDIYDLLGALTPEASPPTESASTLPISCIPDEGEHQALSVSGEVPGWFHWHEPLVSEAQADVIAVFDGQPKVEIKLFGQHENAELDAVSTCLWRVIKDERHLRLDALGITEKSYHVAHGRPPKNTEASLLTEDSPLEKPSTGGTCAAFLAFLGVMGWATDTLPGNRRSGWLENLWTLSASRATIWASWCAAAWLVGIASLLAFGIPFMVLGGQVSLPSIGALLLLSGVLTVLGLRVLLRSPDVRSAGLTGGFTTMAIMGLAALSWALGQLWGPLWAGAVPLGGLLLAACGTLTAGPSLLAAATTLPVVGLLAWSALRVLDEDLSTGSFSSTEVRRASGNYLPEALLLFAFAAAGPLELMSLSAGSPLTGLVVAQLACIALPALLVGRLLSLPTCALLRLKLPSPRSWALLPLVILGSLAASVLTSTAQAELLQWQPEILDRYLQMMERLWAGGGVWALALLPGICEELLFRGAILGLLGQRGRWVLAVVLQALLFGLLHVYAFKLLPTAVLGLLLGVLAVRCGSVWPGVIVHLSHNALLLLAPTQLSERLTGLDTAWLVGLGVLGAAGFGAAWQTGTRSSK